MRHELMLALTVIQEYSGKWLAIEDMTKSDWPPVISCGQSL